MGRDQEDPGPRWLLDHWLCHLSLDSTEHQPLLFHGAHLRPTMYLEKSVPQERVRGEREGVEGGGGAQRLHFRGTNGIKPTSFNTNIILS